MSVAITAALPRARRGVALLPLGVALLAVAMLAGVLLGPAQVSAAGLWATVLDALGIAPLPTAHARDAAVLGASALGWEVK